VLWERMEPLLPKMKKKRGKSGRTPTPWREILDGIFWILRTGAPWSALPSEYPPRSTVHERFQMLVTHGFFRKLVEELSEELHGAGVLNLTECFIDGTFSSAKRGAKQLGRQNVGKARKSWSSPMPTDSRSVQKSSQPVPMR